MAKKLTRKEIVRSDKIAEMAETLRLVYSGACGRNMGADDDYASLEELESIIPAVCEAVLETPLRTLSRWVLIHLANWVSPTELAEHLVDSEGHIEWLRDRAEEKEAAK